MRRIAFSIVCALSVSASIAYGQHNKVLDSLHSAFIGLSKSERADCLIDAAISYRHENNQLALSIMERATEEALPTSDSALIVLCWRIKGQILYDLERTDEAIALFETALEVAKRHQLNREQMKILTSYGINLSFRSQYDKALQKFFMAQEFANSRQDTNYQQILLNNIGVVHYKLRDYKKACFYWTEASRYQKPGTKDYMLLVNLSLSHANIGSFKEARHSLEEGITACGPNCNDRVLTHIKYASGYIFLGLKQYDSAESEFLQSYKYADGVGDSRMKLDNIYLLAEVYHKRGETEKAFAYLDEAENVIRSGIPFNLEILKIYLRLSELHLAASNFKEAAQYQAKYISLKDSIYSETLTTSLMETEAGQLEKVNIAQIEMQKELISLKEELINHEKRLNIVVTFFTLVVLVFLIFIYGGYRIKKKLNRQLDQRVKERTAELEHSNLILYNALHEHDLFIDKLIREVIDEVCTVRGLCAAGKRESDRVCQSYFERIDQSSNRLTARLRSVGTGRAKV